jgi:hypothetical protein
VRDGVHHSECRFSDRAAGALGCIGGSVLGGVFLDAVDVHIAIRHAARALTFVNHAAQAFHGGVMGLVQGVAFVGEQFHGLANAARLVNAALLANRQVHGQMQKRILSGGINIEHAGQGRIHVRELGVVLGVLVNPLTGQNFDGLQGGARSGLGVGATEKAADIGLGGLYQHANIVSQGH